MGLQVWLPLNGNLNNQGLSNVTATNNGATVDNNGKIGKCYSFDGTDDFLSLTNINCNAWAQCTVSFWCYPTANFNYMFLIRGSGAHRFRISGDGLVFRDTNHSSQTSVSFNTTIATNTWSHITCIYNRGEVFMYVNGILTNHSTTYYNSTSVLLSDLSEYRIARQQSSSGNNYYAGKINDFRIYNHALSAQEVKLLSQGLILHYPLDRNGWGQDNIASKYVVPGSNAPTTTTTAGRTVYIGDYSIKIPATENADTYFSIYYSKPLESGKIYTLSGTVSGIVSGTYYRFPLFQQSNTSMGVWQLDHNGICSLTFTMNYTGTIPTSTVSGVTYYRMFMDDSGRNIASGQGDIIISNIKLEEGSKVTNWIPNVNDSLYQTMNISSTVEYDISGYQNNGTRKNTFTYTTNSPKYKLATIFNGSNNSIAAGQGAKVKDAITISCWGYMNSWSSYNGRLLSCTEGGGWNFEPSSGKMNFAMGTGTSSNTYKSVTSITTLTQLGSGWHMFTGTYDGFNTKIYIDGVLENTNAAYTTKTPIYYLAANGIFVGAEAAGSATDPTGSYFNGYLSDVRIYATALSADDIKSLYESNRL